MTSQLSTLPIDVFDIIACILKDGGYKDTILRLRLVCHELNQKTLYSVGRFFFAWVWTDLSDDSLQRMKNISEHEHFRHYPQNLLFSGFDHDYGTGATRHIDGRSRTPLSEVELLCEVLLRGLVNCRSFHFIDYGYSNYVTGANVIDVFFAIITETGLPVKSFNYEYSFARTRGVDSTPLDQMQGQTGRFKYSWSHLQELILYSRVFPEQTKQLNWLAGLVLSAPNLQSLSLYSDKHGNGDSYPDFSPLFERLSLGDTLPNLQQLDLSAIGVQEELLSRVMLRFRESLRGIRFWRVLILHGGTWPSAIRNWEGKFPLLKSFHLVRVGEVSKAKRLGHDSTRIFGFPQTYSDQVLVDWLRFENDEATIG